MLYAIEFCGDARKNIAESANDNYEGLLHQVAVEYLSSPNVTLLYCFNMDLEQIKQLFSIGEWFWENAVIPEWAKEPLKKPLQQRFYYTKIDSEHLTEDEDKNYTLVTYQTARGIRVLESLNSLLEFREISRVWSVNGERRTRRLKRFSIRIDENKWSGPEEFDSLNEIRELLKTKYKAQRLVPVTYTPWDSKEWDEEAARRLEDLTLLYLFEYQTFEIRRY
ncbi:MAG: hypothetical protein ACOX3R_09320 [Desulfitobacteriia bacterium]|jgi:hypothetical protein